MALFRDVVEFMGRKKAQCYDVRWLNKKDPLIKTMLDKGEEMPWHELKGALGYVSFDAISVLHEAQRVRFSLQE